MRLKGWSICTLVLLLAAGFASYARPHPARFHHLQEVKAKLDAAGYACCVDSANGQLGFGFLVSREYVSWREVTSLCKSGPMGQAWSGKVWIGNSPDRCTLESIPDGASVRVWGDIVAFGDEAFLSQIDDVLTESLFHIL